MLNLDSLTDTALLLIYGCPSGGKSTLAKRIATHREGKGHQVTVADPHGSRMEWGSWPMLGAGSPVQAAWKAALTPLSNSSASVPQASRSPSVAIKYWLHISWVRSSAPRYVMWSVMAVAS